MSLAFWRLVDRFRLATTEDVPALRTFFERQLDGGGTWFDAVNPFAQPMLGVCLPLSDVWLVTVRHKVVAAGWFHLRSGGEAQVVALTAPDQDKYTDPLLAYIEAALQVIAHQGRIVPLQATAWVPRGVHQLRLAAVYIRRGWTRLEPTWWVHLHQAQLRTDVLTHLSEEVQPAGLVIQAEHQLTATSARVVAQLRRRLRGKHQLEDLSCAVKDDQVIAVSAVERHDLYGSVLATSAHWLTDQTYGPQVDMALTAAALLHRPTLPDLLTGTGDIAPYQQWFTGVLNVEQPNGFVRAVDADRSPTTFELTMGFNQRRIWLTLDTESGP